MQSSTTLSLALMIVLQTGQVLAAPDTPTSSYGVTQKKPAQGNSADKARKGHHKAGGDGVVSGLGVGASTTSPSSLSVRPGEGVGRDGKALSHGNERLSDPRSAR